ncbi:MAG: HEAT repeat domain-containing protein [Planctomycetes bacterium]|nr:HEAT repeat domain-containing protein [Planctomycetota bacterium]
MAPVLGQAAGDPAVADVKDGLSKYKKGDYKGAMDAFDAALAKSATDKQAQMLRDEVNEQMALDFINSNLADAGLAGRYSRFGKWILAGRKKEGYPSREKNAAQIEAIIKDYMAEKNRVVNTLRAGQVRDRFGDFAIPTILTYMHSESESDRYNARVLLVSIGTQGVNALVQIMGSTNKFDRQVAALALGDIGDPRGLPVLAEHYENTAEDALVREACRSGIESMRMNLPETERKIQSAKDFWFNQAEGYYRNNSAGNYARNQLIGTAYAGNLPVLLTNYDRTYTVWRWVPGAEGGEGVLIDQEVPLWSYADLLAEESGLRGFELGLARAINNPGADRFVADSEALLCCIRLHLHSEGMARYFSGSAEEKTFIINKLGERGMTPYMHGRGLAALHGSRVLYNALSRSLSDGYPEVSVAICDVLASEDMTEAVGTATSEPLLRALGQPDRRVRYAAARALVKLGRTKDTGKNADVEDQTMKALQESAGHSVLLIAENEALRNPLSTLLKSYGYNVVEARTLEDGARSATLAPLHDAIILQGDMALSPTFFWEPARDSFGRESNFKMETIFDILATDVRTSKIPVLIAALDTDLDARKKVLQPKVDAGVLPAGNFFTYTDKYSFDQPDGKKINTQLEALWSTNIESSKNKTNEIVELAAESLAKLDPASTKFNVEKLLEALVGGLRLEARTSASREKICKAIGVLVGSSSRVSAAWVRDNVLPKLLDTIVKTDDFTEATDTPEVRAAAALAMGQCFRYHAQSFTEDHYKALKDMLRYEEDLSATTDEAAREASVLAIAAARNAAGVALGQAPLTPAQRLEVTKAQAVIPHVPNPDRRGATAG